MSTNFPTSIDSFSTRSNGQVIDASHVNNLQDSVAALETKIGVDSSAVTSSIDYKLTSSSSISPGHKHKTSDISSDDSGVFVPTGTIIDFGIASTPTGFLKCDGSAVSRSTYSNLFTLLGTTYGVGNGTSTFNLPTDISQRVQGYSFDFSASKTQAATTTISLSHTIGGTDSVLVALFVEGNGTGNVSSVQYGGVSMTHGTDSRTGVNFYYMLAPTAGTANITASFSSAPMTLVSASYRGFSKPTYIGNTAADFNGGEIVAHVNQARFYPGLAISLLGSSDTSATAPVFVNGIQRVSKTLGSNSNASVGDIMGGHSSAIWTFPSTTFTTLYNAVFSGINPANLQYTYIKT